MKFYKRPVVVEAMQVPICDGSSISPFLTWWEVVELGDVAKLSYTEDGAVVHFELAKANPGDWIICEDKGNFTICTAALFPSRFEPVD